MKRRQLIERISDELISFMPTVAKSKRDLIADFVLSLCEIEGMLPPEYLKEVQHPAFNDRKVTQYVKVNEWE